MNRVWILLTVDLGPLWLIHDIARQCPNESGSIEMNHVKWSPNIGGVLILCLKLGICRISFLTCLSLCWIFFLIYFDLEQWRDRHWATQPSDASWCKQDLEKLVLKSIEGGHDNGSINQGFIHSLICLPLFWEKFPCFNSGNNKNKIL